MATTMGIFTTPSNSTTAEEFQEPFDEATVIVCAVILIFFLIFGFLGNLLTILVIMSSKKLNTIFNQFILSLCFSDLFSSTISWINLYRRTWGFNVFVPPNFFCWLFWGGDMWTSLVTAMHILSFAILRLLSVWKPMFFNKIKTLHGRIWIGSIWVIGFCFGFIPFALFSGAKIRDRSDRTSPVARWPACTQNLETLSDYSHYIKYMYPIFFYTPLVAIVLVSICIAIVIVQKRRHVQKARSTSDVTRVEKQKNKEKQAILQLALIVGSFMMGYIPFTVFEFWTLHNTDTSFSGWKSEWLFGTAQYMFLRFSECLNPIFYNLASTKMRGETKKFISKKLCIKCTEDHEKKLRSASTVSISHSGLVL